MRFCSLASGSSGNCIYVGTDDTHVLIDIGISCKKIESGLNYLDLTGADIDAVLVTHEHTDHIGGLGVFSRRYGTPVYCTEGTRRGMDPKGVGDLSASEFSYIAHGDEFLIGDLIISPFNISHDSVEPCAYKISCGDRKVGIVTDLGCYDDELADAFTGMDVLLIEANHDERMLRAGRYPYYLQNRILSDRGHLSNEASGKLLGRLLRENIKQVFLGHLSKDNNYPALALETVKCEIDDGPGMLSSRDFPMDVASRDMPSSVIEF